MVFGRWLDKPQRLKAQLSSCSCPWWKAITAICRNLHCKGLAWTRPSGDFSPGKTTDWHLVSPWYDFTQLTGIKKVLSRVSSEPQRCPASSLQGSSLPITNRLGFFHCQESPQLLSGTSWEHEDLHHRLKCLIHSKHYICYDNFLNRDWNDYFSSCCRSTHFSSPPSLEA